VRNFPQVGRAGQSSGLEGRRHYRSADFPVCCFAEFFSADRVNLPAPADWKSAMQQVGNLRYSGCGSGALWTEEPHHSGTRHPKGLGLDHGVDGGKLGPTASLANSDFPSDFPCGLLPSAGRRGSSVRSAMLIAAGIRKEPSSGGAKCAIARLRSWGITGMLAGYKHCGPPGLPGRSSSSERAWDCSARLSGAASRIHGGRERGLKLSAIALFRVHMRHPEVGLTYTPSKDYNLKYSQGNGQTIRETLF
jgi:hypothetical protein